MFFLIEFCIHENVREVNNDEFMGLFSGHCFLPVRCRVKETRIIQSDEVQHCICSYVILQLLP